MFGSYFARNFAKPGKPAPLYHIIIGAFLLGYSLEYPHIRTCRRIDWIGKNIKCLIGPGAPVRRKGRSDRAGHEIMEETRKAAAKLPAPAHH